MFCDFLSKGGSTQVETGDILHFGAGGGHLADIFKSVHQIKPICLEIDPELSEVLIKNLSSFE